MKKRRPKYGSTADADAKDGSHTPNTAEGTPDADVGSFEAPGAEPELRVAVTKALEQYRTAGVTITDEEAFERVAFSLAREKSLILVLAILRELGNVGVTELCAKHFELINRYRPGGGRRDAGFRPYESLDYLALPIFPPSADPQPPLDTPASELDRMIAEARGLDPDAPADQERATNTVIRAFEDLHRLARLGERVSGLRSGFQGLDLITSGFHRGGLTIIGGRPGSGKTSLRSTSRSMLATHDSALTTQRRS